MKKAKRLILALLINLTLSLLFASLVHAHGGEGDELYGPGALWMVALIYIQLSLIPAVGLWLAREALAAWHPRNHNPHVDLRIRPRDFKNSRAEGNWEQ